MSDIKKIHCLFEQSGTFKKEFIKLGYPAFDYDILNNFGETNFQIDLFKEIENAYENKKSIFDDISQDDLIFAFFPCVRFEAEIILSFQGNQNGVNKWSLEKKLEHDMKLQKELSELYYLVSKMVLVCLRKDLKLIIENPYSSQHYLTRYWALKPSIIDEDRRNMGDAFKKPTQYFFINFKPKNNFIFESIASHKQKRSHDFGTGNNLQRSMITSDYANRFIREYILEDSANDYVEGIKEDER